MESDHTKLRSELWRDDCEKLDVSKLDRRHYAPGVRTPTHFLKGVCLFERISRNLLPGLVGRGLTPIENAIEQLQKAQSTALLPAQRTSASLFEGVLHCKQLDAFAAGSVKPSMERRCFHRSAAKASFARVDLSGFALTYEEGTPSKRFEQVVDEMLVCQGKHLHVSEAASCGMLIAPSARELAKVADDASAQVFPRFFGSDAQESAESAVSPIAGMMSRRLREATAAATGSDEAFAALERKNAQVQANTGVLDSILCNGLECIPGAVGKMRATYEAAIQTAITYKAFVDRSIQGLLLDENKQDVSKRVTENQTEATEQVKRVAQLRPRIEGLRDDLTRLSVDTQGTATVQRACQLLFCEIYRGGAWLTNACRSVDPSSPTREPMARTTPLCQTDPARQLILGAGTGGATATTICREAGFDPILADCSSPPPN
jgi:hypothetical protein